MIAIVSNSIQECAAFAALCESRGWPCAECDSLRAFKRLLRNTRPKIVLTRHRFGDAYSDDVIAALLAAGVLAATKVIVLIGAGSPSTLEVRQVALGADCVQRDPVRPDVLAEYLGKYYGSSQRAPVRPSRRGSAIFRFAGGRVCPIERRLERGGKVIRLTPKEIELVELLVQGGGAVVTYNTLYSDILGRRFRGETSNMRVLLGLLGNSLRRVGVPLRRWVEVIPKTGYRYRGLKLKSKRAA